MTERQRRGWLYYGLTCFALGAAVMDIVRDGTAAVMMAVVVLFGKWLIGKLSSTFFDEEISTAKSYLRGKFALRDPVKLQIWGHHKADHAGRFADCDKPECQLS